VNLIVDTSVWSLLLRRQNHECNHPLVQKLKACLELQDGIFLIGPILQEILGGVRNEAQFYKLTEYFSVFPLLEIDRQDYVEASRLRSHCRSKGVQAGPADFLIATACIRWDYPLLTTDSDFTLIARHSPLVVL
jgi:predicted nucleic acid-binding protein